MDKIILKAQNREKLDEMIKRTITLNEDETLRVNVLKNPRKILFFNVEGIYEIEIIKKSETVKSSENRKTDTQEKYVGGRNKNIENRKENKISDRKNEKRKTDGKKDNRRSDKTEKRENQGQNLKTNSENTDSTNLNKTGNTLNTGRTDDISRKKTDESDSNYDKIRAFMKEFIVNSKLDLTIVNIEKDSDRYVVNVDGKDIRYLIGEKGSTLNSVEYLLSSVKQFKNIKVVIDSNNYKDKREESLRDLARKKGKKVLDTGRAVKLNPMSARERKIIHEEVSFIKGLKTESVGEEPKRYLVIKKSRD